LPESGATGVQAKKKPGSKAGQFIREETPRKGRGGEAASQAVYRVRCEIEQAEKWTMMSIILNPLRETLCAVRDRERR